MATMSQRLLECAELGLKAGVKSGDDFATWMRKNHPKLCVGSVSHLYLVHRMARTPAQYGPAIAEIKKGSTESLSKLIKTCQKSRGATPTRSPATPTGRHPLDKKLAEALGLEEEDKPAPARKRRPDPPPVINPSVYDDMVEKAKEIINKANASAKKVTAKKK